MKLSYSNNAELVIQARNERDYLAALKVADVISKESDNSIVVASVDESEFWVHLTAVWGSGQRQELVDSYAVAKKSVMRKH